MPVLRDATVGLFDSGVGGLSVLRRMLEITHPPWGRILYLADLARFPYGPRQPEEVREFALRAIELLAGLGASAVAVACNTAASAGIRAGEVRAGVPVADIIGPGARLVTKLARSLNAGRVIVLGTEGTISSGVWQDSLRSAGYDGELTGWPCPLLAKLIEEGKNGLTARQAAREAVSGLKRGQAAREAVSGLKRGQAARDGGIDSGQPVIAVLGCTHYAFAAAAIEEALAAAVDQGLTVVDPAGALAVELATVLREGNESPLEGMSGRPGEPPTVRFLTTGRSDHFRQRAMELLGSGATVEPAQRGLGEVAEVSLPGIPSA